MGSPWAFGVAVLVVVLWLASGPLFHFSDTWQLVINTGTTVITFLMVFLIQNTQNRDAMSMHLKVDELIRAVKGARNEMVDLEELSDEEIAKLQAEFRKLGAEHPHEVRSRASRVRASHAHASVLDATLGQITKSIHPAKHERTEAHGAGDGDPALAAVTAKD
jgi:low affinity Fe/Cu permease